MKYRILKVARRNATEDREGNTRVYFWPQGENMLQNLENRRSRPYEDYRWLLPAVLMQAGIPVEYADGARWRQKAGCTCGCSPGFIIAFKSKDSIHVDIVQA